MTKAESLREPLRRYIQSIVDGWDATNEIEALLGHEFDQAELYDHVVGHDLPTDIGGGTCSYPDADAIPQKRLDKVIAEFFVSDNLAEPATAKDTKPS